jgi:hypothetical protein
MWCNKYYDRSSGGSSGNGHATINNASGHSPIYFRLFKTLSVSIQRVFE